MRANLTPSPLRSTVVRSWPLALVLLAFTQRAHAVVLQVDGTLLPSVPAQVQVGLNKGENGGTYVNSATPPTVVGAGTKGPIDPVYDAAEAPQVFTVPKMGNGNFASIKFVDLL